MSLSQFLLKGYNKLLKDKLEVWASKKEGLSFYDI